jgi:predicted dehydrogenase
MLHIGIIGCGGIGTHHARVLSEMKDVALVGVADLVREKADKLAHDLFTTAFGDYRDLIPYVEAVMVCTPPYERAAIVADCAQAGVQIFVEKPLALNLETADRMIEAVERAGVILMVGYVLRFTHPFQIMHETFASGKLGRLVNCWTRRYMPFDTSQRWYGDQSKSGGVGLDFASHDVDWLRWLGGEVREVFGRVDRVRPGIQTDEHLHGLLLFEEGVGSVDASWAPGLTDNAIGIMGTKGSMIVDRSGTIRQRIDEEEETVVVPRKGETIQEHFVRCASNRRAPKVTGHDGRAALEIVLAMQESSRTGKSVALRRNT